MEKINKANCEFKNLTEAIDTTTPAGRMMMQIVGAFAEFEKAILRERTLNGLATARTKGRIGGRRPKLKRAQEQEIVELIKSGSRTAADTARLFDVHPSTICRLLQRY
jgi:DNA invertase Pin-like site-specific DNA recombinase